MRIDVACAVEGAQYVAHNAAMLRSLLVTHSGHDVRIHYLHGGDVRVGDRERLAAMVDDHGGRINFHEVPSAAIRGLPTRGFTRRATWYRIFLPDLLPAVERVLYLDSDLVVVDDLTPLWDLDLDEYLLGAVTNVLEPKYAGRPAELGLASDRYFNAGVLLLNLDRMRRHGSGQALYDYGVREAPRLLWRDQDALNVVLGAERLDLHPRYNAMNSVMFLPWAQDVFAADALEEARRRPAVRHFEGPSANKPWHLLCDRELKEVYLEHRAATPWPRVRREGVTPLNLARLVRRRRQRRQPAPA